MESVLYLDQGACVGAMHYFLDSGEFVTLTRGENGAQNDTCPRASLGILQPKHGKLRFPRPNQRGKETAVAYLPQQLLVFNARIFLICGLRICPVWSPSRWFHT